MADLSNLLKKFPKTLDKLMHDNQEIKEKFSELNQLSEPTHDKKESTGTYSKAVLESRSKPQQNSHNPN